MSIGAEPPAQVDNQHYVNLSAFTPNRPALASTFRDLGVVVDLLSRKLAFVEGNKSKIGAGLGDRRMATTV
jgi:hypothetical protein